MVEKKSESMYDDVLFSLFKLNGLVQTRASRSPVASRAHNRNVIGSAPSSGTRIFSESPQVITRKTQLYAKINNSKKRKKIS